MTMAPRESASGALMPVLPSPPEAAAESAQERHRKNKQFGRISREAQRMKKR